MTSKKTQDVTLQNVAVDDLQLGSTQLAFNKRVDDGFNAFEAAITQAKNDLTDHKGVIDAIVDVADRADAKAASNATEIKSVKTAYVEADTAIENKVKGTTVALSGDATGSVALGSLGNTNTINVTLPNILKEAEGGNKEYVLTTVNAKGQVVSGAETIAPEKVATTEQKQFLSAAELAQFNANTVYTNKTAIVEGIGSVEVGETFDKVPVSEMLTKILYPYVMPVVTGFSVTPGSTVAEKGTTITPTKLSVTATKKSKPLTKVEFFQGSKSKKVEADPSKGGTFTCTEGLDKVTESVTFKVVVSDGKKTIEKTSAPYTFVYPYYHGVVDSQAQPSASTILAMTKDISSEGVKTYSYTMDNQCAVVAFPKSYGKLTKALDPNKFDNIKSFKEYTVSITGTDKKPVDYYVYVKAPATETGFDLTFTM